MLKIGDFSKLARVSVKTLRHYAQKDLLTPAWIDRFTGYRYYSIHQLSRLNRILALKDIGFSLDQIHRLLSEDISAPELRGMMRLKHLEIESQILDQNARLRRIEARMRQIEQEGMLPPCEVALKSIPVQRVIGIRRRAPSCLSISSLFSELEEAVQLCEGALGAARWRLAIYYDPEYRERDLDVEVALPFDGAPRAGDHLSIHDLPAEALMACAVHQGSFERLPETYQNLMTWIDTNSYQISGPSREVYLREDSQQDPFEVLMTEVQFPVMPKISPILMIDQEEHKMIEPKIILKTGFTAVGMLYYGKNEKYEISQLWGEFNPRMKEIRHIIDGAFGLCEPADKSGAFRYLAAMAVSDASVIPDGMEVWKVPDQKYAVFPCTLSTLKATYHYAFETWLPQSKFEYTQGIDYEYYDESFDPEKEGSQFWIYIPVRER